MIDSTPDRSRLKIEGKQDANTQRLKIKPTPTQAAMTAPEPWGNLHQWGEPPEWPTLQPWGDWYKRPWQLQDW